MDVVAARLDGLAHDAVELTGDYHNKISENHEALAGFDGGGLIPQLKAPRLAVLQVGKSRLHREGGLSGGRRVDHPAQRSQ